MVRMLFCLLIISCACSFRCEGQKSRNAIGIEFGGAGLIYDIHYEHQSVNGIAQRIGAGVASHDAMIPYQIGKIFGNRDHHVEIAAGVTYWINWDTRPEKTIYRNYVMGTTFIGYRFQKLKGRLYFRGGVSPFMQIYTSDPEYDVNRYPWLCGGLGIRL